MKMWICSGYPLDSPKGNSITAKRMEKLFRGKGIDATAIHSSNPQIADQLITLNAIKTAQAIKSFHLKSPKAPIHAMLTGTDIHRDIHLQPEVTEEIFRIVNSLIIAHPECLHEIPEKWQSKARVIYPSVELPNLPDIPPFKSPTFTCLGHLREVKNSHLMFTASKKVRLKHQTILLGDALEETYAHQAKLNSDKHENYQWLSGVNRAKALSFMKNSTATLNTSFLEGGANTVIEAIYLGVPVLATDIDGNRGLLGKDYLGLFPSNNANALASLMYKCINEPNFNNVLKEQIAKRLPLFTQNQEIDSWLQVCNLK